MSRARMFPVAGSIPFDNTSTSISADNVQEAIEELSLGSNPIPPVDFTFKGSVSVQSNSVFSVGNLGARVVAEDDRYLEVNGSASVASGGSLRVNNGSVSVRRI